MAAQKPTTTASPRPSKPATVQRDAARANRHQWIDQTLLVVRILSFDARYEAHIQKAQKGYSRPGAWNYLVCIHLQTGPVSWHISPEDMEMFSHLTDKSHKWDGCTQAEKLERLRSVSAECPKDPTDCGGNDRRDNP